MHRTIIATAILASALAAAPAFAQSPSQPGGPAATNGVSGGTNGASGVGGSGAFSGWLSDYQKQNQGRISREAYMDEVGRRWDQADKDKRGLTTDQIDQTYGSGQSSTRNSAPGNMGPNNVKK